MKAIGKNILVKQQEEQKKEGLLIIPKDSQSNPLWEVISVGENVSTISIGDIVFIKKYGVEKINEKEEIYVTEIDQIIGKK